MTTVAVVGGGITGLAAAWEAVQAGADVVVLEAGERFGGKLLTTTFAGRPVDAGADAFLARLPEGRALCAELGLASQLVAPAVTAAHVFVDGTLHRLPDGLVLGVPTDLDALDRSGIVGGPVIEHEGEPLAPDADPTVGELVRGRFGDEVLARLVDPLIGGINVGDTDRLSVRATAPQLAEAAARPGLLSDALRAVAASAPAPLGAPVFNGLPGGMGTLVDALIGALEERGAQLHTGVTVASLDELRRLGADAAVLTAPGRATASLLADHAPEAAALLAGVEYASVVMVTLAVRPDDVAVDLDASGFLVPRTEGLLVTACSWASSKWAHLSGGGSVVLRASVGRAGDERGLDLDDDELVAAVHADLGRTMGLTGQPVEARVTRWPDSFPQYAPGHLARVAAVEAAVGAAWPRAGLHLAVAGAALRGLGIPACIRQGRAAARSVVHNETRVGKK